MRSRHLSIVIRRDRTEVAAFAKDRLAEWAAGLAAGDPRPDPADPAVPVVDSPMGEVRVRFAPPNDLGVLDHQVQLPNGEVVLNPLRVLPHPHGAEVVFTLRQLDGVDDTAFDADAAMVEGDLDRLRDLLER